MATARPTRPEHRPARTARSYLVQSRRPLQILVFLLPLVIAYELGLALLLRSDDGILTNRAHEALLQFFASFGIGPGGSLYLGGVAIVVVLLVWHLLNRDPWTIEPRALGLMAVESVAWTVPLLVLAQVITRMLPLDAPLPASGGGSGAAPMLEELSVWSRLAISVGAGLYEELMFRMLLIAVIHTLLVDVGNASHAVGAAIAVALSATAFTVYHPLRDAVGSLSGQRVLFYFLAGLYFGAVYVLRGFGIVVAVHALYDIVTVTWMPE